MRQPMLLQVFVSLFIPKHFTLCGTTTTIFSYETVSTYEGISLSDLARIEVRPGPYASSYVLSFFMIVPIPFLVDPFLSSQIPCFVPKRRSQRGVVVSGA